MVVRYDGDAHVESVSVPMRAVETVHAPGEPSLCVAAPRGSTDTCRLGGTATPALSNVSSVAECFRLLRHWHPSTQQHAEPLIAAILATGLQPTSRTLNGHDDIQAPTWTTAMLSRTWHSSTMRRGPARSVTAA